MKVKLYAYAWETDEGVGVEAYTSLAQREDMCINDSADGLDCRRFTFELEVDVAELFPAAPVAVAGAVEVES